MWSTVFSRGEERGGVVARLRRVPVFTGLARREIAMLAEISHRRTYEPGEYIFRKGQPGAAMFVVNRGLVRIFDNDPDGSEVELALVGEEGFFGELALLDDSARSASARAERPSELYAFFRVDLEKFLAGMPQAGLQVYRGLAHVIGERLRATNVQLLNG